MFTKRDVLRSALLAAAAGVAGSGAALAQTGGDRAGPQTAKDIAEAGFIFGLPLVMNYAIMYEFAVDRNSGQFKAPFNQLKNEANVFTYKDTAVVTPNSDTPYSVAWLDLRAEPIVVSVPAVEGGRYYSVQLCDGNTYNFGYIGTRATGSAAGDYLVVGPGWTGPTPPGIMKVFRSSTQLTLALFRTQLFDAADLDRLKAVQAGYRVRTLSAFLGRAAPPAAPAIDFPRIDKELVKTNFFEYLDFALQFAPPQPNEAPIRRQLATIGVGAGRTFRFADLPADRRAEIALGMRSGEKKIDDGVARAGTTVNGWQVSGLPGDAAHYDGDWLLRAVAAKAGIYGNDPAEAMYPLTRDDETGQALDGSKHDYTLTFPPGELPPVNAFWSITMYDGRTQLLIENPIGRYLINAPMLPGLKRGADGSLTLYIQNRSPGADRESNWLPAPDGPIYLVMRLYWPKEQPPSILPPGGGTWRPPGVRRVAG
ncbi:DUF1254 domain-containing protein [Reyranella sp.]|uniref:DUF1254 domain-containing protein n=1 Tax=Reyranella sp. TaxID=1929291 RepID=UPI003BA9E47E